MIDLVRLDYFTGNVLFWWTCVVHGGYFAGDVVGNLNCYQNICIYLKKP